jgi:hypothetical protein
LIPKKKERNCGGLASLEGNTWKAYTPENSGLPSVYTRDIEIDKYGNKWIATDKGVAVYREGGVVGIREFSSASDDLFLLPAIPNPAKEFTVLQWQIKAPTQVSITVCDYTGKVVTKLKNVTSGTGDNSLRISTSVLPPGIYICRIETPTLTKCTKLVIR